MTNAKSVRANRCQSQELPCGHFIHSHCFAQYTRYNYTCPVCAKSLGDMTVYFRMIDSLVQHDLSALPSVYSKRIQVSAVSLPARCSCLSTLTYACACCMKTPWLSPLAFRHQLASYACRCNSGTVQRSAVRT